MTGFIQVETRPGQPVVTREVRLLPFAQNLTLRLPFFNLVLEWNRPVSVLAISSDGRERVLTVRDPTRQIVWILYGTIAAMTTIAVLRKFVIRGKR